MGLPYPPAASLVRTPSVQLGILERYNRTSGTSSMGKLEGGAGGRFRPRRHRFSPRRICSRNVRIPVLAVPRYDGVRESWWGRWDPCSHTAEPGKKVWRVITDTDQGVDHPITTVCGEGRIDRGASSAMGCAFVPDCDHEWRMVGPIAKDVSSYSVGIAGTFSESQLRPVAQKGDSIIRQSGGLYPICKTCENAKCVTMRTN